MGTSLPPIPGGGAQAQNQPPGISNLLGGPGSARLPQTGPTPQQRVQAYMEQIRAVHMSIDALAQDHPEAAQDLNDAKNSLTQSMSKVATAMSQPEEQPAPPTF